MDAYWFNKLLDLLMVQTNSENEKLMVLYLDKELRKLKLPYSIDAAGNILVTKGKTGLYPCVVSHLDTVHSFEDDFKIYRDEDDKDLLFAMSNNRRVGIGGDDKCGIFACLRLLKIIPQIKVVFFSREENRCKGSTSVDKRFFADCQYLIQLDRKGKRDFIQTYWGNKTISHDFASEIGLVKKKYKYKNCVGTVTDVMKLWKDKVGISCINLSCGYYKPHTSYEYISIRDLWHSTKFTEEIINSMKPKKYVSLPPLPFIVKTGVTTSYNKPSIYLQCCKCSQWKKDTLLWNWNDDEKICWSCKRDITDNANARYEENHKQKTKTSNAIQPILPFGDTKGDKGSTVLACYECGIQPPEMLAGDSLKYIKGHLFCKGCASVLFVTDTKERVPAVCWVCNKVIPKDHKVIERYGTQICEDCAHPSDDIIC